MTTILDKIVAHKRQEVARRQADNPEPRGIARSSALPERRLRNKLLSDPRFHFICEVKKASPSKGIIKEDFDPVAQARAYVRGGASAVSVLTDEKFFMGHLSHLQDIRAVVDLPILRKDFIIDEFQIHESAAAGADVILLIAAVLDAVQIQDYIESANALGLDVLLEVAHAEEIKKISHPDKIILGINSRDLRSFEVSLDTALTLRPQLSPEVPVIAESGIRTVADCQKLKSHGFCGALIGETLMRSEKPAELLNQFVTGSNHGHPT